MRVANPIDVTGPRRGQVFGRDAMGFAVYWKYKGSATHADKRDFKVMILKVSERGWSQDLGRNNNNYVEALAYSRTRLIPASWHPGTDYYARVIHIPTNATSHSKQFTIR